MVTSSWKIVLVVFFVMAQLTAQTPKPQFKTKEQCDQQARGAFDNGLELNTLVLSEGKRIPIMILVEDIDNEAGVEFAFAEVLKPALSGSL